MKLARVLLVPLLATFGVCSAHSAARPVGAIAGRVLAPDGDTSLERVRVSIEGTAAETFTDNTGFYRLGNVTAGPARVTLFYTGMAPHSAVASVAAGQTARHDVTLVAADRKTPARR